MSGLFTVAGLLIAGLILIWAIRIHRRRVEARQFQWELSAYQGGRVVHAVPIGDIVHVEDRPYDCVCSPWTERFQRGDGSFCSVIYHQRVRR
jgi:hypothetical protein